MSLISSTVTAPTSTTDTPAAAKKWRDFVAASPYADVLQCLEWGQVKRPEWYPIPAAVETGDGFDATALILRRKLAGGINRFYLPRGPILDWSKPGLAEEMLEKITVLGAANKVAFIKIDPAVPDETPGMRERLAKLGFVPAPDAQGLFGGTQPRCNMKLSLEGSLDDIQARFHPKTRYNMRVAAKKGLRVESEATREDLDIFYEIYSVTAGRNRFTGWRAPRRGGTRCVPIPSGHAAPGGR